VWAPRFAFPRLGTAIEGNLVCKGRFPDLPGGGAAIGSGVAVGDKKPIVASKANEISLMRNLRCEVPQAPSG
jgi:hypothetical protein